MEGRAIARPNCSHRILPRAASSLQWRAGQLPGRTDTRSDDGTTAAYASMEGRAIARPNVTGSTYNDTAAFALQWRAGQLPGRTRCASAPTGRPACCFNGGPGNCPAEQSRGGVSQRVSQTRFNGGPGNCPAEPRGLGRVGGAFQASMEGRAIARPNRPRPREAVHAARPASMEGRAIARPNPPQPLAPPWPRDSLQWRAGQLPGRTTPDRWHPRRGLPLQWRAGQLPGRTGGHPRRRCRYHRASMEGRAIARPNRSLDLGSLTCPFAGVCERSRKLRLRRCPDSVVKLRFALCHKASSGPRDLRADHSARIR